MVLQSGLTQLCHAGSQGHHAERWQGQPRRLARVHRVTRITNPIRPSRIGFFTDIYINHERRKPMKKFLFTLEWHLLINSPITVISTWYVLNHTKEVQDATL
jgi:hypothetical protein